jgi:hypothetical protein
MMLLLVDLSYVLRTEHTILYTAQYGYSAPASWLLGIFLLYFIKREEDKSKDTTNQKLKVLYTPKIRD